MTGLGWTKREVEQYERLTAVADRNDKIVERFRALGFEIGSARTTLELAPETAEAILNQLERERAS